MFWNDLGLMGVFSMFDLILSFNFYSKLLLDKQLLFSKYVDKIRSL